MKQFKTLIFILSILVMAALLSPVIAPVVEASPAMALMRGKLGCFTETGNCVEGWNATDIVLYSGAGSSQTLSLDGAAGHIDSEGNLTVADYSIIEAQTAITLTDAGVLTPTGSYQPVQAAGNVTVTLAACSTAGTFYTFINVANVTVTITDTGNAVLSGNAALGQYDALQMLCDGTRMVQIAPESDN